MSELAQAIEEMRNMRESYDQLSSAAEAYNEGKPALAEAITAKGVEAAATDSLATMAEKVMTISQDTYEIDGGEMYAKQLFGSLETPNYWNLYDILAQLLSDGRLVNYGGILLAEYYKGYDSLALSGAGAGGAYVVSDKDANGQFIMYTEDTTHTWDVKDDGKGNRWVAYCFADEWHDFQITNTNTCPRNIFIGRNVGDIESLVAGRVESIVVLDGAKLRNFNTNSYTQQWGKRVVIRNLKGDSGAIIISNATAIESAFIETDNFDNSILFKHAANTAVSLCSVIFECEETTMTKGLFSFVNSNTFPLAFLALKVKRGFVNITDNATAYSYYANYNNLRIIYINDVDNLTVNFRTVSTTKPTNAKLYVGYSTNGSGGLVLTYGGWNYPTYTEADGWQGFADIELQEGWRKSLNVVAADQLTEENIVNHILNKLGDNSGQPAITITLGSTNLAKLTEEEKAIATNKGFILA